PLHHFRGDDVSSAPDSTNATCACGATHADGTRPAPAVDPAIKDRNLKRLRRIEGQVRGLQRLVTEDRYSAAILPQTAPGQAAPRSVGRELMRNHLKHCAAAAIRSGDTEAEAMYDEIIDLMYKHIR